jgi:peptidoglycan hydrolase CwlO-like protein
MADMDMDYIEHNMQDFINVILNDIDVTNQENTNVETDITMLQTKYEKQKFELERLENRLSTLQNVRWASEEI